VLFNKNINNNKSNQVKISCGSIQNHLRSLQQCEKDKREASMFYTIPLSISFYSVPEEEATLTIMSLSLGVCRQH